MKIRSGFVSNSSSSSFIVINSIDKNNNLKDDFKRYFSEYVDFDTFEYTPETGFGWEFEMWDSVEEKFDWICLFADFYKKEDMLLEFLQRNLDSNIKNLRIHHNDYAYVDHQSLEDSDNNRMFDSIYILEDFMFSKLSKIYTGNDNSDQVWSDCDDYKNCIATL